MTFPRIGMAKGTAIAVAAGYLFGYLTSIIPAPTDPDTFWIANLAAPYVLIPWLAGWFGRSAWRSAALGAAAAAAAIAGFYHLHDVGDVTPAALDLDPLTTGRDIVIVAYRRWFDTFLFGHSPWLTVAIVEGAAFGLAGWWWRVRGKRWAAMVAVGVLLIEPVMLLARVHIGPRGTASYPATAPNVLIWGAEALAGCCALWWVWSRTRTGDRRAATGPIGVAAVHHPR